MQTFTGARIYTAYIYIYYMYTFIMQFKQKVTITHNYDECLIFKITFLLGA